MPRAPDREVRPVHLSGHRSSRARAKIALPRGPSARHAAHRIQRCALRESYREMVQSLGNLGSGEVRAVPCAGVTITEDARVV
jgi:hypothetical protein